MKQVVYTSAGGVEYTWPLTITELAGLDISADPVHLSLGTVDAPGDTWVTPDLDPSQTNPAARVVRLLINAQPAGRYWLWIKVADGPETVVRRSDLSVLIA